jgi:hypothetical protein
MVSITVKEIDTSIRIIFGDRERGKMTYFLAAGVTLGCAPPMIEMR